MSVQSSRLSINRTSLTTVPGRLAEVFPINAKKVAYLKALETASLEYTAVLNGYFLDYFVVPHVKSYLGDHTNAIDIANKAAGFPGSGNVPLVFTYSGDIGNFTAALLTQPFKEKVVWCEGGCIL